jgi:hypothetical protein
MPVRDKIEFGKDCYLHYQNHSGSSWSSVGDFFGVSANAARTAARFYRRKFRKAWPPLVPGDPRRKDARYYKGELEGADLVGIKVAPGVVIAPWYETLDKWDVLL